MEKQETISGTESGQAFSFACGNKRTTSKGVVFMSDTEYAAHKAEQEASMRQSIRDRQAATTKTTELDAIKQRIKTRTHTAEDLARYIELKEGL